MYEDNFGKGTVKNLIEPLLKSKKVTEEIPSDFLDTLNEEDHKKSIYHFIINYLANHQNENPEVLVKYKWMQEFILWTSHPEKSKIKFEYCLSESNFNPA